MAVIIPKELLEESGASEGDTIKLSLAIPKSTREMALESIAGLDRKARPFARETGSSCFSTPAPSSRS